MLIDKSKYEKRVEDIISSAKEKIYEKELTLIDLEILETSLSKGINMFTDDTKTAEEFLNELKGVFDKYNVSKCTTILQTALVYLFEIYKL